jgi:ATP-binding cassette subfamily F protein 3
MLRQYDGTLILISHDRYLLDQVTNRTFEIENGRLTIFDGPYSEYREKKAAREAKEGKPSAVERSEPASRNGADGPKSQLETLLSQKPESAVTIPSGLNAYQLSKERQRARVVADTAEKKVASLEARLKEIETKLSHPAPTDNVVALSQEHGGVQVALDEALTAWEKAAAYAEALG